MSSKFYTGDSLEVLRTLPDCSVQCVITSPPCWGLRDYGVAGQLGLEPIPEEYLAKMTEVFREVRRVLRDDGTCWVNMGDSYAQGPDCLRHQYETKEKAIARQQIKIGPYHQHGGWESRASRAANTAVSGLKPKDLVGMPWKLAFALQADGWYLRSDIIWHKPNPMPDGVQDRPTKAHEYIFLLTKSSRYFWDSEGVREPHVDPGRGKGDPTKYGGSSDYRPGGPGVRTGTLNSADANGAQRVYNPAGRNIRTVWTIPSKPFKESHFATFPPALVERCVKAGTSERGCCPSCGKAWVREVERERIPTRPGRNNKLAMEAGDVRPNLDPRRHCTTTQTIGFRSDCDCLSANLVPCVVLDPFSGAGTVSLVCERLGRDSIGIELNPKYVAIAERRLERNRRRKVNGHGKEVEDLPDQARFAWVDG